jgi:hypothetical protein
MADNFDEIREFLDFTKPETMYYVQIFLRRKDDATCSKNCKTVRSYYIRSLQAYDDCRQSVTIVLG